MFNNVRSVEIMLYENVGYVTVSLIWFQFFKKMHIYNWNKTEKKYTKTWSDHLYVGGLSEMCVKVSSEL